METTITLPSVIWSKASNAAMSMLDDVETGYANREDGPAFWSAMNAADLERAVAAVDMSGETVAVTMSNGLWSIFLACFEIADCGDTEFSHMTDVQYDAVIVEFAKIPGQETA